MPAAEGDPRDPDGDGVVTVLDSGFCTDQCTNPDCSPADDCGLGAELVLLLPPIMALRRLRRRR
jgi:hypothetical protein